MTARAGDFAAYMASVVDLQEPDMARYTELVESRQHTWGARLMPAGLAQRQQYFGAARTASTAARQLTLCFAQETGSSAGIPTRAPTPWRPPA